MSKKWYNYLVSVDDAAGTEQNPPNAQTNAKSAPSAARNAAQSVADIASGTSQASFADDNYVVETLTPDGANKSFHVGVLPR
jgi:hypothetical protein